MSELVLAIIENADKDSITKLAKMAKINNSIIQDIILNMNNGLTVKAFVKILKSLKYSIVVEKNKKELLNLSLSLNGI